MKPNALTASRLSEHNGQRDVPYRHRLLLLLLSYSTSAPGAGMCGGGPLRSGLVVCDRTERTDNHPSAKVPCRAIFGFSSLVCLKQIAGPEIDKHNAWCCLDKGAVCTLRVEARLVLGG